LQEESSRKFVLEQITCLFRVNNLYLKNGNLEKGVGKMTRSEELFEQSKRLMPGGVNSPVRAFKPYPFFTERSKGSRIFDVDGRGFIDYCMGYGPLLLGHTHPKIIEAVKEQLEIGFLFGTPTEQEARLADLICKLVPCAEMVRLVSTGSEATMSAIRVARGYTGKKKLLKFEGCYHGAHDSVLVKAGSGATTFGVATSLGVPEESIRNTVVVPFNDISAFEAAVKENKDDLAAVIVEPAIGNFGVVLPKEGFLEVLREVTETHGVVLIFDEVITGFRMALGGAQEYFGVVPDIVTLGKVLGGGFPMAAFGGRKEIMAMVAPSGKVYQAGTFSGNPVSVAAGLATIEYVKSKGSEFYKKLESKTKEIVDALTEIREEKNLEFQINHISSMFQIFFTSERVIDYNSAKTANVELFSNYHQKLLEKGVFVPPSQFETCFTSASHTTHDINETSKAMASALAELWST
jgi:glutamate-1-semialdehyde 2,1-aminomutase